MQPHLSPPGKASSNCLLSPQDTSPASLDPQQQQTSQATNLSATFDEEQEEQEEIQIPSGKP